MEANLTVRANEYTVLGTEHVSFTTKEGLLMEGVNLYGKRPIDPKRGQGERAERFFLSAAKVAALPFKLRTAQRVEIVYNRWGRVETLRLLDDEAIDIG